MTAVDATPADGTVLRDLGEHGKLVFHDGDGRQRRYMLHPPDGEKPRRLASVTTVLRCLDKPAIARWAEACGAEGAHRAWLAGELSADVPADEAILRVRALGLGADAKRDEAAGRGLDVHALLEQYARDGSAPNPASVAPEHRGYVRGLASWLAAADPEPTQVERIVCHPELGYAGRMDLRARVGGRDVVIDLKSTRRAQVWPEAWLQSCAYSLAEWMLGEPEPDAVVVVSVGQDGAYEALTLPFRTGPWLAVLDTYRALAEARKALSTARKEARA